MKTQTTLAVAGGCVLLLLAGCDRTKLDRLGEGARGAIEGAVVASSDLAQTHGSTGSRSTADAFHAERIGWAVPLYEGLRHTEGTTPLR